MTTFDYDKYLLITYDRVVTETTDAYLLDFGDEEIWVPKSLINPEELPLIADGSEIYIEKWFCKKEGLENYEA